ncbi:MAG: hypothetical protein IPF52_11590 [Saprospiraceae bacterium]|nr:hypothetical protein [Saprospiraceae bacterium]
MEGVFTHIKSFDYFKTDNYSKLLAFLESEFDVYIMGHSCGLSDRTLLSTIFEHENCRKIKIFLQWQLLETPQKDPMRFPPFWIKH